MNGPLKPLGFSVNQPIFYRFPPLKNSPQITGKTDLQVSVPATYDLTDPQALAAFLTAADIRLVRAASLGLGVHCGTFTLFSRV